MIFKRTKKRSLQSYLFVSSYISILVSIVIVSIASYIFFLVNAKSYAEVTLQHELNRYYGNTSFFVQRIHMLVRDITFNTDIQSLLIEYNRGGHQDLLNTQLAMNRRWAFYVGSFNNNEISNAVIFALNGDMLGSVDTYAGSVNIQDFEWFPLLESSQGGDIWLKSVVDRNNRNSTSMVIPVVKKILSINTNDYSLGKPLGYLLIYIDALRLAENISLRYRGSIENFIVYSDDTILAHVHTELIGTAINLENIRSKEWVLSWRDLYYSADLPETGWKLVCNMSGKEFQRIAYNVLFVSFIISVTLLLVFLFISMRIARIITRPIIALQESFSQTGEGDFSGSVKHVTHIDEIDSLTGNYNRMMDQLTSLIHDVYESKLREQTLLAEVKKTEIEALQLQINPHFLYNTLDSINWMALSAGNTEISNMVISLGDFFRSNMDAGSVFTTLEQNLENVRSFLYIQKIRFEKKLEYHFSVEDEVLACKTLRFLMQPLVENTIKHGVQPCKHPCMIEIVAQRKGERLIIRVEDNGVGIDEATLEELRNQWENIENIQVEDRHVGLINLMKRLWLCYQREASFIIAGKEGQGAKIEVGIPVDFHSESLKKSEQIPPLTTPLIQKIF